MLAHLGTTIRSRFAPSSLESAMWQMFGGAVSTVASASHGFAAAETNPPASRPARDGGGTMCSTYSERAVLADPASSLSFGESQIFQIFLPRLCNNLQRRNSVWPTTGSYTVDVTRLALVGLWPWRDGLGWWPGAVPFLIRRHWRTPEPPAATYVVSTVRRHVTSRATNPAALACLRA